MPRRSIVIVGGGISGLAAAWELSGGALGPNASTPRIEIFESNDAVGGSLRRTTFAERSVDCGADGFLARRPEATTLVKEMGWGDQLESIDAEGAWLYLGGQLSPIPSRTVLGVPTSAQSLKALRGLSWRARWGAWRDEHAPRKLTVGDDATIGEIVRAKLGDELAYRVVEPMIGGIQAGRIDDLSARSVFPALLAAAQKGGSLMAAISPQGPVNPGPTAPTADGPAFCTLLDGIGSLPEELSRQLRSRGVIITTSTPATSIRRSSSGFYAWEVDSATTTTPANAVIVATPPKIAGRLLGDLNSDLAALERIDSASAAMVTYCLDRATVRLPASGTGVLVPLATPYGEHDTLMTTAITLLDRKWPHLYRDDSVLVRVHVGRIDDLRHTAMSDSELTARVSAEMAIILGQWPEPSQSMVVRWASGLPQYRLGHDDLVAAARRACATLALELAGNAYDGVGIPASIGSGRRAGRAALASLPTP